MTLVGLMRLKVGVGIMRIKNPPLILDNTVVSRFAIIRRFDILHNLYEKKLIIPTNVISEAIVIQVAEKSIQDAINKGWIEEYTLDFTTGQAELKEYAKLRRRFGEGESAVMAVAKTWGCALASDDLRATKKYCENNNIEHVGCLGILYDAYVSGIITLSEGDTLLSEMINNTEYKCPVTKFHQIIDWFENKIGNKLY